MPGCIKEKSNYYYIRKRGGIMMRTSVYAFTFALIIWAAPALADGGAGNPCGTANPCGGKNPCGLEKSGGDEGRKAIRDSHITDYAALAKTGIALWNDEKLGSNGMTCMSCHNEHANLNLDKVKGWPHLVKMAGDIVTLDQMITYCMINPMAAKPLDANSVEMTAISAYYHEYAKAFRQKRRAIKP